MIALAEAPTKVIISGEHSVVYGYPAIVMAINLKTRAKVKLVEEKKIFVFSEDYGSLTFDVDSEDYSGNSKLLPSAKVVREIFIEEGFRGGAEVEIFSKAPRSSGLGSSGSTFVSVAAATYRALGKIPSHDQIFSKAMIGEKMVHVNPSGVDVEVAIRGGTIRYIKGIGSESIKIGYEIPMLVINSNMERNTGVMVMKFKESLSKFNYMKSFLEYIASLTLEIEESLKSGNLRLAGILLTANHLALSKFGVSNEKLDEIVAVCLSLGAYGAKLTGAGGGGAVIALVDKEKAKSISNSLSSAGFENFVVEKSEEGVRHWVE